MKKILITLFVLISLTVPVTASVFGSFPEDREIRTSSLSTQIRLGLMNAGSEPLIVSFQSPDSKVYNISLPNKITLKSGKVTENPEGRNWYYLGNNKYVKIRYFSFEVQISEYRKDNTVHLPIHIVARSSSSKDSSSNRILQSRSYNYTIYLNPSLRPLQRSGQLREPEITFEEDSDVPKGWRKQAEGNNQNQRTSTGSKDYKANETEKNTGESGINSITYLLIAGVIGLTVYILKVI